MTLPIFSMVDTAPARRSVRFPTRPKPTAGCSSPAKCRPIPPMTPEPLPEGVEAQTRRVMDNLILVLEGIGLSLDNVVSVRIFLTEFKRDYAAMNDVYKAYFLPKPLPARTCIGVTGLARDALVEIDFVAKR